MFQVAQGGPRCPKVPQGGPRWPKVFQVAWVFRSQGGDHHEAIGQGTAGAIAGGLLLVGAIQDLLDPRDLFGRRRNDLLADRSCPGFFFFFLGGGGF